MKVAVSAVGLTPDDYSRSGCDAALATCPRRWKSDYEMALVKQAGEVEAAGDARAARAALVLRAVIATREPWNDAPIPAEDDPYWPTFEFDESAYLYLLQLLGNDAIGIPIIVDDEMRARVADLLYQRSVIQGGKRDFHAATIAVKSYLTEATRRERCGDGWSDAEHRVARAFDLAAELNNSDLRKIVIGHIRDALTTSPSSSDGQPTRYPLQLMRLLLRHHKKGDFVGYAALAERLAQEALEAKRWSLARDYLGVAAAWHAAAGAKVLAAEAQERAAELWVAEGEAMVTLPDTHAYHFALAEHKLLCGIQALRDVRGVTKVQRMLTEEVRMDERIYEVRWLRQKYQQSAVKAMIPIRDSAEINVEEVFAVVEGRGKMEGLFAMARYPVPTRAEIEAKAKEAYDEYFFLRLFALTQWDERGRTTAQAKADDLWAHTCQLAVKHYEILAQYHVGPLLWKVGTDHSVDLTDFEFIVRVSPFVPEGRKQFYARGLYEGFKGNFALALHMLIPQVENSIRLILRSVVTADDPLWTECADALRDPEQPSLIQSLHEPWASELARGLGEDGEDIVFALRVLLVERFGGNLRNCILHGLIPYGGAQDWRCWYLWWLFLKVCCSTALAVAREYSNANSEVPVE